MRQSAPPLLPILRSQAQGRLLARLLLHPEDALGIRELARQTGTAVATTGREVGLLVDAGVLSEERTGRNRVVRVNPASPLVPPLTQLITLTFGPREVLATRLRGVPGIDAAYIFGSWAARYEGERGSPPNDVDVLIIGCPDREALDEIIEVAERELRRPVQATVRRELSSRDPFGASVASRPLVPIPLGSEPENS